MSRLHKYMGFTDDSDLNKFRSLSVKLVEYDTSHSDIVNKIKDTYDLDNTVLDLIDELNSRLKLVYKGKFKFDFCLDEGKVMNEIKKFQSKKADRLKLKYFELCDELGKAKTRIERDIKLREVK